MSEITWFCQTGLLCSSEFVERISRKSRRCQICKKCTNISCHNCSSPWVHIAMLRREESRPSIYWQRASFRIRSSSGSDPCVPTGPEWIRPKLVRLFYPTQTSTDSRPKLDRIEEVSCVRKAYPLQFGIRPKRIRSRVHGAWNAIKLTLIQILYWRNCIEPTETSFYSSILGRVGNYFLHGATWRTENIVEGRSKKLNSTLHNIICISLCYVLTSW